MNEYQRRIDYKEFESYISVFSDLHEEEKASLFYIGPGQRSQAGGSGGIGPIHRYTLFSLLRVCKTWNFLPIYENREIKKKNKKFWLLLKSHKSGSSGWWFLRGSFSMVGTKLQLPQLE